MEVYCLQDFKDEFDKLISNKSYKSLEQEIITYFFGKSIDDLLSGARLNNCADTPYIKKRLKGSSGYRCYFLLILKNDSLYLMFIHPKTGSKGVDNITKDSIAHLYKKILECIKSNNLFEISLSEDDSKMLFKKLQKATYR